MKAMSIERTLIHCDTCHHEFEGEVGEWHNKPCPDCGAPNIITDSDMEMWARTQAMMELVNLVMGDVAPSDKYVKLTFATNSHGGID